MSTRDVHIELDAEQAPLRSLLRDLVEHRDLLPMLAQQHFRGKFRAARLGIAWSAIQPLLRGAVLAIVFTQFVRIPMRAGVPYPAFILGGTAAWAYLMTSVTEGTTSVAGSSSLATRVYFPRLLLPAMPAASTLPSYLINLVIVILLVLAFGVDMSVTLLMLPVAVVLGFALASSLSACLSLLHVYYRDVGPMASTGMGILFYATPIIYPADQVEDLRWILDINPFTGVVSLVRWSLFGGREAMGTSLWWTVGWTIALTIVALLAFRRYERICVDRL